MASDTDSIRNTIAYYSIACDDKEWDLLDLVFTSDCIVQYPEPLGPINGIQTLKQILEKTIGHLSTQNALLTQVIRITSDETAIATTYITTSHYLAERSFVSMGKLEDELIKVEEEDEDSGGKLGQGLSIFTVYRRVIGLSSKHQKNLKQKAQCWTPCLYFS